VPFVYFTGSFAEISGCLVLIELAGRGQFGVFYPGKVPDDILRTNQFLDDLKVVSEMKKCIDDI